MTSLITPLSSALAASLPHHLMNTINQTITIYPNSIHFGHTNGGGGILVNQISDNFITVAYHSTAPSNLRFLLWGKEYFACIPGIALQLEGDEFTASVKLDFSPQAKHKDLISQLTRFIGQFVVKCEKLLDAIYDGYIENMYYEQLCLEARTANYFLQSFDKDNLGKQFDAIYSVNRWGCGSGAGSLPQATVGYRKFLQDFLTAHQIKTIADAGCGDWQFTRLMDLSSVQYTGYDVSSIVIEQNTKHYQKDHIKFVLYDGDFERIEPADLLICKDVLQHLPNAYIQNFLKILPKFKYALLTNDINELRSEANNQDIPVAGGFRPIDLTAAPFNLKAQQVFDFKMEAGPVLNKITLLYTNEQA